MSRECKYCSNVIVTDYVKCPVCDSAYYPGCVKQTKVSPNGGYQKCCCRKNSFTLSDFRSLIKEKNVALSIAIKKDFSYQLKTVVTSVESLTVTVNKNNALLNDRISAVETVNKTLETNLAILETKVANNAECVSSLINHMGIAGCSSNAAVLEEVEERLTRRGNILIFGVSESKEASKETREAHDRSLVINIMVTYIPPDLNIQVYTDFLEALSSLDAVDTMHMDASELVILGDFNSPMFYGYFNSGNFCAKAEVVQSFATFLNLIQYNNVPNHMGRVLDLVFGSIE
ncbi:hypothetical protein KQX54_010858 [Cotesia glomerata]|uniref:Endonuclease/exonuclease/phosphatase domain-containing protein n=1 Tax=Cotesia glomerata TaxID=32391 RepID=A0AAV7HIL1_COTGL|nr:hypothetical protein KQX54_010858 [Cotesia glomerata]